MSLRRLIYVIGQIVGLRITIARSRLTEKWKVSPDDHTTFSSDGNADLEFSRLKRVRFISYEYPKSTYRHVVFLTAASLTAATSPSASSLASNATLDMWRTAASTFHTWKNTTLRYDM